MKNRLMGQKELGKEYILAQWNNVLEETIVEEVDFAMRRQLESDEDMTLDLIEQLPEEHIKRQ